MATEARPVRVEARLAWKSCTALSMRVLSCCCTSLSAGIPAIAETAMSSSLVSIPKLYLTCWDGMASPWAGLRLAQLCSDGKSYPCCGALEKKLPVGLQFRHNGCVG